LKQLKNEPLGKIVVSTVKDDPHGIEENTFLMLARAAGFQVIDLGVDVPAEKFVEAVEEKSPEIVDLSGLLTITRKGARCRLCC